MKGTVELVGLDFYAFHGVYEQEQKIGNRFSVDVKVEFDYDYIEGEEDLSKTVNYEVLYQCVKQEMDTPNKLLETLAAKIMHRIFNSVALVNFIEIAVSKFNPPFGGVCERSRVTLRDARN